MTKHGAPQVNWYEFHDPGDEFNGSSCEFAISAMRQRAASDTLQGRVYANL